MLHLISSRSIAMEAARHKKGCRASDSPSLYVYCMTLFHHNFSAVYDIDTLCRILHTATGEVVGEL